MRTTHSLTARLLGSTRRSHTPRGSYQPGLRTTSRPSMQVMMLSELRQNDR